MKRNNSFWGNKAASSNLAAAGAATGNANNGGTNTSSAGGGGTGGGVGWNVNPNKLMQHTRSASRANAFLSDSINILSLRRNTMHKLKDTLQSEGEDNLKDEYEPPPFDTHKIYKIIESCVDDEFKVDDEELSYIYDRSKNVEMSQRIAQNIKEDIKKMNLNRYRIIALVSVVEKHQQTIQYRMKFSLDPAKDNYVKYRFENAFIYIIVTVLLVYKD